MAKITLNSLVNNPLSRGFSIDYETILAQIKEMTELGGAMNALEKTSATIRENLLLGNARAVEFKTTIASITPVLRLVGGDIENLMQMIEESSKALGRVIVFNKEIYTDLYLLGKLLGTDYNTIVKNFSNVGISIANVGGDIEKSIGYIKSIGMDAKSIMKSVVDNTDLLNRFNFKEGVLGFSKMAATAAMLKVDMNDIQSFADKVFDVDGAIETASAFQRLGVFTGELGDPFALMNKSLNDPNGLVKSIALAAEQFTTLDTETGRISINPSAIGLMKELGNQTGYGAEKIKRMAINMREFNERASQINFKFNLSEDDEMLIANMAYLDKKGEYVINLKDEQTGNMIATKVSELTEPQIKKLKEISEKEPEQLVDIAKQTMSITEMINNSVTAMKYRMVLAAAGSPGVLKFQEDYKEDFVRKKFVKLIDETINEDFVKTIRGSLNSIKFDANSFADSFENLGTVGIDVMKKSLNEFKTLISNSMGLEFDEINFGSGGNIGTSTIGTGGATNTLGSFTSNLQTSNNASTSIPTLVSPSSTNVIPVTIKSDDNFRVFLSDLANKETNHNLNISIKLLKENADGSISTLSTINVDTIKTNSENNKRAAEISIPVK